jgi:hypothetical protein
MKLFKRIMDRIKSIYRLLRKTKLKLTLITDGENNLKCADCGKKLSKRLKFVCLICKEVLCYNCFDNHMTKLHLGESHIKKTHGDCEYYYDGTCTFNPPVRKIISIDHDNTFPSNRRDGVQWASYDKPSYPDVEADVVACGRFKEK